LPEGPSAMSLFPHQHRHLDWGDLWAEFVCQFKKRKAVTSLAILADRSESFFSNFVDDPVAPVRAPIGSCHLKVMKDPSFMYSFINVVPVSMTSSNFRCLLSSRSCR